MKTQQDPHEAEVMVGNIKKTASGEKSAAIQVLKAFIDYQIKIQTDGDSTAT